MGSHGFNVVNVIWSLSESIWFIQVYSLINVFGVYITCQKRKHVGMIAATYGKIIYKYLFSINPRESLEILGQPCIRSHHFKSNWSIQIYLYILKGLDSAWLGLTPSKVPRTNGSPRVAWVGHSCIWGRMASKLSSQPFSCRRIPVGWRSDRS